VNYRGHKCTCGNVGCAEAEAAGWSLPQIARETPGFHESGLSKVAQLDFQALFAAARNRDAVARAVQQHCLNIWAANSVAVIHAYDPEVVVFGGGVMQSPDVILTFVQKYVEEHAWTSWGTPQVRSNPGWKRCVAGGSSTAIGRLRAQVANRESKIQPLIISRPAVGGCCHPLRTNALIVAQFFPIDCPIGEIL
jgi:predicted NBD/HSP70 family sugar kinase